MSLTSKPQNTPENSSLEAGSPIAPREIRELIARLTEQSVEAVPAHESRTVEALAIETGISVTRLQDGLAELRKPKRFQIPLAAIAGFVALAGVAYWAVVHTPPVNGANVSSTQEAPAPVVVEPPKVEPDISGTVPVSQVTFGPDSGQYYVDTGFEPTHALPEGMSVSAQIDKLMWGTGDHRAAALDKPLTSEQEKDAIKTVEELLRYIREDAGRRHLKPGPSGFAGPGMPDGAFQLHLGGETYHGSNGTSVNLPPPGKEYDALADRLIPRAAKDFVGQIQEQLRGTYNSRRRNNWP